MSRPTTLEELGPVLADVFPEESRRRALEFRPRPDDVIISPSAKSGTTWTQHIVHGLRTRGSLDFEEISDVVPWLEAAHELGIDLNAPQVAEPRVFKSHLSYHEVPKGARYVCPIRNPRDVAVSIYRFFEGWFFEPGSIDLDALTRFRWPRDEAKTKGYFYHLSSFWERRHDPNVLLLCYEDMLVDLEGSVRRLAQFLGIQLDDELREIVVRQSSREFMLKHRERFDERRSRECAYRRRGIPYESDAYKVTAGASDSARYRLSDELERELDDIWHEQIAAHTGLSSYEDMRRALRELHERR